MNKPIILAICGKSATGKDSLAKWLYEDLLAREKSVTNIVSHTSRPKRLGENDGQNYIFISKKQFLINAINQKYLEYTRFRDWYYGTPKNSINCNINIGVFNVDGLISLYKYKKEYTIIPIYLEDNFFIRLKRSKDRENKYRLEHFRRAFVDFKDFINIKKILQNFEYSIIIKDTDGVLRKTNLIEKYLQDIGVI